MNDPQQSPDVEQERVRRMLTSIDVPAPPALRTAVEDQIRAARTRRRLPRVSWPIAAPSFGAIAAVAVILAVLLSGPGANRVPTLGQATQAALSQPTAPAPSYNGRTLDVATAGIPFPNWAETGGWRATGTRSDTIEGRKVVTVFYSAPGHRVVGYAIVSGGALPVHGGQDINRGGVTYTLFRNGATELLTWQRQGHTCVIAGHHASPQALLRLATTDD